VSLKEQFMRTKTAVASSLFVLLVVFSANFLRAQSNQISVTGFVTDTLAGKRGANALHADAAKRAVASGMAQYALYDEKTHKLYIFASQDSAVAYLGQHITITGTVAPSPMAHGAQVVDPNTNEVKDFHHVGQDSATPVAGVLTIASVAVAPPPKPTAVPATPKTVKRSQP
jgi:hypothetical protein